MSYEREMRIGVTTDVTGRASFSKVCHCRLTIKCEVAKHSGDEVNQEAEANADICNILHTGLSRPEKTQGHDVYIAGEIISKSRERLQRSPVQFTVDWQDSRVAQEGEGHGGDGVGALQHTKSECGCH